MSIIAAVPYRYRGRADWRPEHAPDDIPPDEPKPKNRGLAAHSARQAAESEARRRAFCAHRDEGLSVAEAAELLGVSIGTGRRYEAQRRRTGGGS